MVKPLSFPIRLDLMQTKGKLKLLKVNDAVEYHVPYRTCIMVLSGIVYHVTGTASETLFCKHPPSNNTIMQTDILAGLATDYYPLFNTASEETQAQTPVLILEEKDCIAFDGGAGSYLNLLVIEWKNR